MGARNGTSWSGRCEAIPDTEEDAMGNCAGVDWAGDKHDVRVCDEAGEELLAATFVHDEKGLRALCRTLVRLKAQLVAIERPDGLLLRISTHFYNTEEEIDRLAGALPGWLGG